METPLVFGRSKFETVLQVRPDDIDMNQHVHNSRYFDYVLAARFDQMARCYGVSMDEFMRLGFSWVNRSAHLEYKRPLHLGDSVIVRTWVEEIRRAEVTVHFEIEEQASRKLACEGKFRYILISVETGRPASIPRWIMEKYAI
jgi:acyl-CoA thioester hydrolase/thioesterase-3